MGATAAIATFIANTATRDFPADSTDNAQKAIADTFAAIIAGAGSEVAEPLHKYLAAAQAPGPVAILGTGMTAAPETAALINGNIGIGMTNGHYQRGFHATGTLTAFNLAAAGFTAAPDVLEAKAGFFSTYGVKESSADITASGLGKPFVIIDPGLALKNFRAALPRTAQPTDCSRCARNLSSMPRRSAR